MGEITSDQMILQTVTGEKLEFDSEPIQNTIFPTPTFSTTQYGFICSEIKKMFKKGLLCIS